MPPPSSPALTPLCAPSRAGLLTGAYQQRFGLQVNPDYWVMRPPESHPLLPEALRGRGYATGMAGK